MFYDDLSRDTQCNLILVFNGGCNRERFYGIRLRLIVLEPRMYCQVCNMHVQYWMFVVIFIVFALATSMHFVVSFETIKPACILWSAFKTVRRACFLLSAVRTIRLACLFLSAVKTKKAVSNKAVCFIYCSTVVHAVLRLLYCCPF